LDSVPFFLICFWSVVAATARVVGHLQKSTEVMKLVNGLMKAPQMAVTMQEFSREMMKAGVIEEVMNDELDSTLDNEDIEEEIEEEVDKVLSALAGETAAQLPATAHRVQQPSKQPDVQVKAEHEKEQEAVVEGGDDDAELEALRARLANVRS
jgi:charged multivesicular body protein 3